MCQKSGYGFSLPSPSGLLCGKTRKERKPRGFSSGSDAHAVRAGFKVNAAAPDNPEVL